MDLASWAPGVAVAVIGVVSAYVQTRRRATPREQIRSDLDIYKALPDDSAARSELIARIDEQIVDLIKTEKQTTRDFSGFAIGVILLAAGIWSTLLVASAGGAWSWFYIGTGFLLLMGLYGSVDSLRLVRRDERGNRISRSP